MMRVSWYADDKNHEIKAYDHMGVAFYYLGEMDKAIYYHLKMVEGYTEKDESIKLVSKTKLLERNFSNNPYNVDLITKKGLSKRSMSNRNKIA
jgi:hypothetical protein